ncbi:MAG TPA: lipopolysaccharide biosynthesis protein [Candidatus Nitrosocosmicus sp.]|jgi:O-antigen/teichoic acid export membrane protein|nr:lipopolysaccharide biosynthesis protein [Candidatus Nitrosocosmicus sp.]
MPPQDLGRKSLLLLGSTWFGSALGMVVSILVARTLGPEAVGSIGFSTGLVGLFMAALLPGFAQAHLKRLAEGQDPGRCLGTMLAVRLGLDFMLVLGLGVTWAVSGFASWSPLVQVFLCMLGAQVATGYADVYLKVFLAREWVVAYALILLVARVARLAATLAVLAWAPHITWVAATFPIDGLVSLAGAAGVLAARHGIGARRPTAESFRGYWRFARPFLVTTPIALFQDSIDRVVVGRWAGLTAAGYYHIARALWEALSSVMQAPATLLFTRLSQLYAKRSEGGDREARGLFENGLDKLLFLVLPLGLGLWAGAEIVIGLLYGSAFLPAVWPLRLLVLAAVVASIVNPYTLVVNALEQTHRFIPVNLLRLIVYLAALGLLVPGLLPGAPGAALARLVLIAFPAWVYVRWTRELAGVGFYGLIPAYLAAFALGLGVFHGIRAALGPAHVPEPWAVVPAALGAFAAYFVCLGWMHPRMGANLRYALSLLSPRAFQDFLRAGLRGA